MTAARLFGSVNRTLVSLRSAMPRVQVAAVRHKNHSASSKGQEKTSLAHFDLARIRNIGIMAHIDAGKTTTTERMLFFSGATRHIGNVDEGDTQMDYLDEERERGITIVSAATTFAWGDHRFNLIDTPGHVDFTLEVERALRVLDGSVAIFDSVHGVQAQTMTVWRQARKYGVPVIGFLNKMDRPGASVERCISSIEDKMKIKPLVMQVPIISHSSFAGVLDVLTRQFHDGNKWMSADESNLVSQSILEQAAQTRASLIENLADADDDFATLLLSADDMAADNIALEDIKQAIRRATLAGTAMPLYCGASRRDQGVQPLMDGVVDFLPSPLDRPAVELVTRSGKNVELVPSETGMLSALAFKVVHDPHRGPLVFTRVYSGIMKLRATLNNTTRRKKEKASKLLKIHANRYEEIEECGAGNIVAIAGLKETTSGDTLLDASVREHNYATGKLHGIEVPEPVFSCTVECERTSDEIEFLHAMRELTREDPSVRVSTDEESGQTLLSGMGELHLEIIKHRLHHDYRLDVFFGDIQVAYRERPTQEVELEHAFSKLVAHEQQDVQVKLRMRPSEEIAPSFGTDFVPQQQGGPPPPPEELISAVESGALAACSRGCVLGFPLYGVHVDLLDLQVAKGGSAPGVAAAAADAVRQMLSQAGVQLMQPVMLLEATVEEQDVGSVLNDITSMRHGHVRKIEMMEGNRIVIAEVPLAHMVGYATTIRSLTSGRGTFTLEFDRYDTVPEKDITALKKKFHWA